ncbi:MAG: hypothetical protein KJ699_02655 [Alphaproteobacteria bacterium]|nr:hypothetical protein [Alphaproteobacteria bacterium]MBU1279880.1 hypothetical protein [Alphaproteobacteria bacterium]MBU1572070.1 hypothetical protein [Alphaproteobacteria bacterium]MBU2244677.1 hypothetical protein [Alphaproteobacteria bacterium]
MEIALSTSISGSHLVGQSTTPVALDLNFATGTYLASGNAVPLESVMTFSRASTARMIDANGISQLAAVDTPRFDHSLSGQALGLLYETAAKNEIFPSNFSTGWNVVGGTNISASTAPDGLSARLLTVDTGASDCYLSRNVMLDAGTSYTVSFYCRRDQNRFVMIYGFGNGPQGVGFDLVAGTAQVNSSWTSARIELLNAAVARVIGTLTPSLNGLIAISPATNIAGAKEFTGGEMLTIWGGQLETGIRESSLISTSSTAITRAADQAGLIGLNGTYDVRIAYDDDTETALDNVVISEGWWPSSLNRSRIKRLVVY